MLQRQWDPAMVRSQIAKFGLVIQQIAGTALM
jgi:hypothetical protein